MKLLEKFKNNPLILLLGPTLFSFELVFLGWAFSTYKLDPISFAADRGILAVLLMLPFFFPAARANISRNWRKIAKWLILLGVLRTFTDAIYYLGQKYSNPTNISILSRLSVPVTAVLAFFILGEKLNRGEIFSAVLMLAGTVGVVLSESSGGLVLVLGDLLILTNVVVGSLGDVLTGKSIGKGVGKKTIGFFTMVFSTAVLLLVAPVLGSRPLENFVSYSPFALGGALFSIANILIFFFYLEHFGPAKASIAYVASAVIAPVISAALSSTIPPVGKILGGLMIIVGAVFFIRSQTKAREKH